MDAAAGAGVLSVLEATPLLGDAFLRLLDGMLADGRKKRMSRVHGLTDVRRNVIAANSGTYNPNITHNSHSLIGPNKRVISYAQPSLTKI